MFSILEKYIAYIPICLFWIIPLFCIVLFSVLGKIFNKKRFYLLCSLLVFCLDLFLYLCHPKSDLKDFAQLIIIGAFFGILISMLLNGKKQRSKVQVFSTNQENNISLPKAEKICLYNDTEANNSSQLLPLEQGENGIRLNHVNGVLSRLKKINLSAGDRLEVDVIDNMLNIFSQKSKLLPEETQSLNDYLATLLKMMAKYSM